MSGALARTAFRLAACQALRASPFVAAACPGRVFDSLVGVFDGAEPVPVIVLATEDDNGEGWSKNDGGPPFDQVVDATLEITVCTFVPGDGDAVDLFVPATDPEAEALLDALEFSALEALTLAQTPEARLLRQAVTRRVTRYRSVRFTTEDTQDKLARRLVTLTVELKGDDGPASPFDAPLGFGGVPGSGPPAPPDPFAALPEPLRTVAGSLPAGSSALATVEALLARLPRPVAEAPFAGAADVTYDLQSLREDRAPDRDDPNVPVIRQEIPLA